MDASCKIQRSIHVFNITNKSMCPDFWVHIKKVCVLIFIFFTIMPIAFKNDFFRTGNGSSTFWLSLMYIVGSYFGKYGVSGKKFKPLLCGLYGLICAVVLTVIVVVYSYNNGV